jgi:hypothetical protein
MVPRVPSVQLCCFAARLLLSAHTLIWMILTIPASTFVMIRVTAAA